MARKQMKLKRTLSLLDAVSIGLGAIIGAGIYVVVLVAPVKSYIRNHLSYP